MADLVLHERDGDVVVLTFNDPERRNAMTRAMGEAFAARIADLARDATLRAVILTGAGRAFSAGGDMGMLREKVLKPVLRIRNLQGPPPRNHNPLDHHYYNLRQEMRRLFKTLKIAS